jgi:hypothetical protein
VGVITPNVFEDWREESFHPIGNALERHLKLGKSMRRKIEGARESRRLRTGLPILDQELAGDLET